MNTSTRKYQVNYKVPGNSSPKRAYFRAVSLEQAKLIAAKRIKEMNGTLISVAFCMDIK